MEAREALLNLEESHSSLVSLLFWIGFKREFIPYQRLERKKGKSAWTFRMRTRYFLDSMFAFSDLPIKALFGLGAASLALCTTLGIVVFISKFTNQISIPGYAATVLIVLFFSALNSMGLAIIGSYTWRAFENTKRRPLSITLSKKSFDKRSTKAACLIKTGA